MEKQAELPKIWCVGVAVCAASYTFDRLFSYIAMQEIPAGCRVVVPFGKGNAKRVGIVLSCAEQAAQPEQQLKPVLAVVDKQPILSPEMLDLVFWLKEMTFCTYYDAVRTILPAGMQVQLVETISLAEPQPDCLLTDAEAHLLFFLRGAKTKQEFRRILADADTQGKKIVDTLVQKGFLLRQETVKEKTHGQTGIKMLRMAAPPDEVPPVTKTQQKLVRILQETGAVSEKEACYLSGVTTAVAKKLVQNGVVESYTVKPPLHTYAASGQTRQPADIVLSAEQQAVYDRMVAALGEGMHCFLLHGVTGSGKTSVFIRLIDTVVQRGKQVILLVPEIALTPQIVEQFYQLFGSIVAVIHSELSLGQRSETWRSIASGAVKIIIGTRSAVFAPVQNLGLIVVDEEGERTYKSDSAPRYHAISVAKKRCQTHHCPLLLASATPSVESYYFAKRGIYTLLEMHQRYNQTPLPHVEVVDMQEERTLGKEGVFSETLAQALRENFEAGSQSLLLLNLQSAGVLPQL